MSVTIRIKLYTSKTLKDGTHPVLLIVTKNRQRKKISLGINCKLEDWDSNHSLVSPSRRDAKNVNDMIYRAKIKAQGILFHFEDIHKDFSLNEFEVKYKGINSGDVFEYFDDTIDSLRKTGKIGNANVYEGAKNTIQKFHTKSKLNFNEVNHKFLQKFEEHLRKKGNLNNSISIHMRTLRALFNKAIKVGDCKPSLYPFKTYEVGKLKNETTKLAIKKADIELIKKYKPNTTTTEELSKHLFLFSYYTMGMNFSDMAKLKWGNISDNRINYIRSKTGKKFSIKILPPVQKILIQYKSHHKKSDSIFPILEEHHKTPTQIATRIKSGLKTMNKHMKSIGESVGIEKKLTSYVARHTWATVMKRSGVSKSIISEGLGHSSEKVTEIYLDSFENEVLDAANEKLL